MVSYLLGGSCFRRYVSKGKHLRVTSSVTGIYLRNTPFCGRKRVEKIDIDFAAVQRLVTVTAVISCLHVQILEVSQSGFECNTCTIACRSYHLQKEEIHSSQKISLIACFWITAGLEIYL